MSWTGLAWTCRYLWGSCKTTKHRLSSSNLKHTDDIPTARAEHAVWIFIGWRHIYKCASSIPSQCCKSRKQLLSHDSYTLFVPQYRYVFTTTWDNTSLQGEDDVYNILVSFDLLPKISTKRWHLWSGLPFGFCLRRLCLCLSRLFWLDLSCPCGTIWSKS